MDENEPGQSPTTDATPVEQQAPAASPPSPQPSTETSTDTGTSKESILDAVLKVVPATNESDVLAPKDADAAPPEAEEPDSQQAETDEPEADDDDEPPAEATPAARKKINKLLKQRRELRTELSRLQAPAEIGSELEQFAKVNNLTGEDIAGTLRIAAMLRHGDYQSFYQAIAPFVRTAQEYLGVVLPKDLAERVRTGQMTEAVAKDYARQRFDGARSKLELEATEKSNQRQQVQSVQSDVQRAVSGFELRLSANDPDYKAKAPAVRRHAQALLFERGGTISSVEEALEITQAAYNEVNRQMRSFRPPPRATHPQPNGASQTPSARAAPKTLMEAALQGLENARRGG